MITRNAGKSDGPSFEAKKLTLIMRIFYVFPKEFLLFLYFLSVEEPKAMLGMFCLIIY